MDAERVIRNAVVQVIRECPFYGHVIAQFPKVFTNKISTLAVGKENNNGFLINLYVNPEYVESIYTKTDKTSAFNHFVEVIKHEILHTVFRHLFLRKPDQQRQMIACELSVNSYINREKLVDKGIFPEDYEFPERLSFEEYYNLLPENPQKPEKSGNQLDSHEPWSNVSDDVQTKVLLQDIVRKAKEAATSSNTWGNVPQEIRENIDSLLELQEQKVPWESVLRDFIASASDTILDYTNKRQSKRYGTRPGTKKDDVIKLAIGIDTSASIDQDSLKMFFSEIQWIAKGNSNVTVFECDAQIQREYPFREFDGSVKGRGGTDLEPVFKEASERHFDALIYFTDAFAPKVKENYSIPVLLVVNNDYFNGQKEALPYPADIVFQVVGDSVNVL